MSNRNFYMIHVDLQETSNKNAADQRRKVQIFVLQQKVHMRKEKKTHKLTEAIYKMQSQNFVWQYSDEKKKKYIVENISCNDNAASITYY